MEKRQTGKIPVNSLRMRGISVHFERAQYFWNLARSMNEDKGKFHLMIAAIYSCRAIIEFMLEAAEKQEVKGLDGANSEKALREKISPMLPFYELVYKIRIHDFHRFAIVALIQA